MRQSFESRYKWAHEGEFFVVSDVDKNFYACRYMGSQIGFVIDKEVFYNHLNKGKIESYSDKNIAV